MKIPLIRDELLTMADNAEIPPLVRARLRELAEGTRRRPFARKAPTKQHRPCLALREAVRDWARANPDARYQEIGERFRINNGRVS